MTTVRGVHGNGEATAARRERHLGLAVLALLNALAALFGACALASGVLGLGGVEGRLPGGSPVLGGVALFVVVAVPNGVVSVLAWRGDRRTGSAAVLTGVTLVVWILVELAFLRELSFFHPVYLGIAAVMIWLGRRASR